MGKCRIINFNIEKVNEDAAATPDGEEVYFSYSSIISTANYRQMINSQARTAVIIGLTSPQSPTPPSTAITTATAATTKIIAPKILHLTFFIPSKAKIPARSIRTPTVAVIKAGTFNAIIALIADRGEVIPQIM